MTLPIDRTNKAALDSNLVNGVTSDAPKLKANNDTVYNTIDELFNYAAGLVSADKLSNLGILNVKDYGAKGDGTTDDTSAIQSAIDAAEASGGGIVFLPEGIFAISAKLTVKKPIFLVGVGKGSVGTNSNGTGVGVSELKWIGSTGDIMVEFKAATVNNYLFGGGVNRILFDGNTVATTAIHAASVSLSHFTSVEVRSVITSGITLDGGNGVLSQHNYIDDYHFVWGAAVACHGAHGIVLGNTTDGLTTQTHIKNVFGLVYNGNFLLINGSDNNVIEKLHGNVQSGGTGYSVYFANNVVAARSNLIQYMSGSIYAENGTYGNRIMHLTSEGNSVTAEAGAQLHYEAEDYVKAAIYKTHFYDMTDQKDIPIGAMTLDGSAAAGLVASQWGCINFPDSATSRIGGMIPAPYNWGDGTLQKIRIWFSTDTANTSAQWRCTVKASCAANASGTATPQYSQSTNVPVQNTQYVNQYIDISVNLTYTRDNNVFFSIQRLGSDANDTALGNIQITGVSLIYQCKGPDSSGSGTYAVTLPYV